MKCYYAHFMGIYNTPQEKRDLETLSKLGFDIINPNTPEVQEEEVNSYDKSNVENYLKMFDEVFGKRVRDCEVFAFRGLPDGRIPGGVYKELGYAKEAGKIIIELPSNTLSRGMDGEQTREYLKEIGQR